METFAPVMQGEKPIRVPEWVYYFTDEQFMLWCKQRKLQIAPSIRTFPDEERAAIYKYMVRQHLVN